MAEMMGGAFLTVVFQKLFEQLASPELRKNSVISKLKMLEEKLKKVRVYLDDAEDRQLFDGKVKEWLDEHKHVVFMADDLIEQIISSKNEKHSRRKAAVRVIKPVYHSLVKTVQDEIGLILTDLDGLFDRALVLELKHINNTSTGQSSRFNPTTIAPLREEHHVFGREAEKEKILKMLLSDQVWGEDTIGVLPIVGMGGLGKTTLAQLVYNDKRVKEHGFLKAWVTVSIEFDFCRIMKELLRKVNPEVSGSDIDDPNELQCLMKEALREKRFLFVLDDVWNENYSNWDLLMSNFTSGNPRSRVIVTTRSGVVGSIVKTGPIHKLKEIQKDHCWSIFVHHPFNGDKDADPQLQAIGRKIVHKCKGLPLAIRCLGGLLRFERSPQKWENILRSDVGDWSKVMENGVLPSLWLSYRYLSPTLKQCFAYCSILPQDYEFDKKQMVLLWMAEGLILSKEEDKSLEDVGEEHFDDLVLRSLFQRSREDRSTFIVHDLVHDLATFVYGKFCFRKGDDLKNVTIRTRHLTYDNVSSDLLTSLSTSKHLRSFRIPFTEMVDLDDFVKEMVLKVRCLRVVSLSLKSSVLHHSLCDLKMLRYLDLSGSNLEELPDSICSLFHLQTLTLSFCHNLTRLPMDLPDKLSKLRHLDTFYTSLTKMPPKMGCLKELRILTDFVLGEGDGSGCSGLKELGELHHLGGTLYISKLQNVGNLEDVQKALILGDKTEMKGLELAWQDCTSNTMLAKDVLDALQPHKNLESLGVYNYPGSSFPKWVGEMSFSRMVSVYLSHNSFCCFLPPLGQLPFLRELYIEGFDGVEKIGNEFLYGNDNSSITPFPCLEDLSFSKMSNWKECSFSGNESGCFPRLKTLSLTICPEMESTKLHHFPSLCQLYISLCPLLEKSYQKYRGDHWHCISHIPEIYISGSATDELEREEEEKTKMCNKG